MCSTYPTNKEALFCLFTGCYSTLGTLAILATLGTLGTLATLGTLGTLAALHYLGTLVSLAATLPSTLDTLSTLTQLISQERTSSLGNFLQFQKFDIPPCLKLTCKSFKLDFASTGFTLRSIFDNNNIG